MNLLSLFTKQTKNGVLVYLPPGFDAAKVQYYYQHAGDGSLIPNSKIYADGALNYEINSLGCKGAEIDPSKPTIGIFGVSTTSSDNHTLKRINLAELILAVYLNMPYEN